MVQATMNPTLGKILLVGLPLLLSLSWFIFWVVRLLRMAKRLKGQAQKSTDRSAGTGSSESGT